MQLENSVCIVTGSAGGIGAATAILLAQKGAHAVVNYNESEANARATRNACSAAGGLSLTRRAPGN